MREEDVLAQIEYRGGHIIISYKGTPLLEGSADTVAQKQVYDALDRAEIPGSIRGWLKHAYDTRDRRTSPIVQLDRFNIGADVEGLLTS